MCKTVKIYIFFHKLFVKNNYLLHLSASITFIIIIVDPFNIKLVSAIYWNLLTGGFRLFGVQKSFDGEIRDKIIKVVVLHFYLQFLQLLVFKYIV